VLLCNQREEKAHFIDTENNRQFLSFLGAEQIENRPLALERPFIEEFDSAQINGQGAAGNGFVVDFSAYPCSCMSSIIRPLSSVMTYSFLCSVVVC
jgi:hypothetical protein